MNRFDQIASWVVVAVFVVSLVVVGTGLGLWLLSGYVISPQCGDVARAQLEAATEELSVRITGLEFSGISDDCDSGGTLYASWRYDDDLTRFLSEARAAGCQVNDDGLSSDDAALLTCSTSRRGVVVSLDHRDASPVSGWMSMA